MNAKIKHFGLGLAIFPLFFFYTTVFLADIENSLTGFISVFLSSLVGFVLAGFYAEIFAPKIKRFYWLITLFIGVLITIALLLIGLDEATFVDASCVAVAFVVMATNYYEGVFGTSNSNEDKQKYTSNG
ncbi:DUF1129 domain-containing protein [Reinekea forsetii]|nr:DUF1129 domain-containing protein [Reinekea forsetii]